MKHIVLTGGGTAGHCIPNLALIPQLKNHFDKISYIGSDNGIEKDIISNFPNITYYGIKTVKFNRKISFSTFSIPFKLLSSIKQARNLLEEIKPDVIFSKGGYVSLPVVFAGSKIKIPCVTHESDLSLGLANKLISKKCKYVFTSFEDTAKNTKNGIWTGSPIREELFYNDYAKSLNYFNFNGNRPILLVTGGSLGSDAINNIIHSTREKLLEKFDIIHLCGKGKSSHFKHENYRELEYLPHMEKALNISDIVVSRGGSNALFELIALKKPTLVIPLPKGNSRGDQILNAEYFKDKGLVKVIRQEHLTEHSFIYTLNELFLQKDKYVSKLEKYPVKRGNEKICYILSKITNN